MRRSRPDGRCGGGGEVVRDVLCGEFPPLLLREEVYATAALAGAAAYLGLHRAGVPDTVDTAVSAGLVFTLRMAAVFLDLHLPRLRPVPG
ncbi:TRIC cation channel family protein [Streptomyces sp. NPDC058412]|uniref:TRIC cation channel family protein n=1 Tax=Streptomyces sp. NPDC058412 TaxID=3346486 RepID=UPI00364DA3E7